MLRERRCGGFVEVHIDAEAGSVVGERLSSSTSARSRVETGPPRCLPGAGSRFGSASIPAGNGSGSPARSSAASWKPPHTSRFSPVFHPGSGPRANTASATWWRTPTRRWRFQLAITGRSSTGISSAASAPVPPVGGRYRFEWHITQSLNKGARLGFTELGPCQFISQQAVKVVLDILGSQLPTVYRRLVMPVNALADVQDNGCVVRRFPAFR